MSAWDYPIFIIIAIVVALIVGAWLMRVADPKNQPSPFICKLCGLKDLGRSAKHWHFCPNCGAAKDAERLHQLAKKRQQIYEDIDTLKYE